MHDISVVLTEDEKETVRNNLFEELNELAATNERLSRDRKAMFLMLLAQYISVESSAVESSYYGNMNVSNMKLLREWSGSDDTLGNALDVLTIRGRIVVAYGLDSVTHDIDDIWESDGLKDLCSKIGITIKNHVEEPLNDFTVNHKISVWFGSDIDKQLNQFAGILKKKVAEKIRIAKNNETINVAGVVMPRVWIIEGEYVPYVKSCVTEFCRELNVPEADALFRVLASTNRRGTIPLLEQDIVEE